ncbi:hypothetical protein ACFQFC_38585 [Amorphoplanes digitatis]|uniref:Uncharacterized protein n=1 Tax=Actinoplanes digitatis TaxID=1868 RepID=A0A7W7HWK5_9ACTN|nr:hypothetical protein [Actinoplanes digitatis]MBB4762074.1 hypothetical protein [Actinoplanes digitatis]GID97045.1 hypothetical protein Adi01nite_64570 [Actinoplanes digitatis]
MYEQQQPWGQPQQPGHPPQGAGGSAIALTLKYHPLAFLMGFIKPQVQINGHPVQAGWKARTVLPVQPGQYHLHVHVPYLIPTRIGVADLGVNVLPGQTVELEYRAPMIAFMGGALGGPPQKYPGMAASIVLLVISLVILLCVCGGLLAAILSSSNDPYALPAPSDLPAVMAGLMSLLR